MGFFIELALDVKTTSFTDVKNEIISKANVLRSDFMSQHVEFFKKKSYQILSFSFPEHDEIFIEFIFYVKKIPHVFIETAGIDETTFTQLYASKRYLNIMEKEKVREYLIKKKNGTLKNINPPVFNALVKKVKKRF